MKTKILLLAFLFILVDYNFQAQLLDKLKQRAKEKGLETREFSFVSSANEANRSILEQYKL